MIPIYHSPKTGEVFLTSYSYHRGWNFICRYVSVGWLELCLPDRSVCTHSWGQIKSLFRSTHSSERSKAEILHGDFLLPNNNKNACLPTQSVSWNRGRKTWTCPNQRHVYLITARLKFCIVFPHNQRTLKKFSYLPKAFVKIVTGKKERYHGCELPAYAWETGYEDRNYGLISWWTFFSFFSFCYPPLGISRAMAQFIFLWISKTWLIYLI